MKNYLFICLIFACVIDIKSQEQKSMDLNELNYPWFASINYGLQMSGIKDEDFVSSNYTPLFILTIGKRISPLFAVQIGYKGFYFNYIEDDLKHHYNYYYIETLFNLNNAIDPNRLNKTWNLELHAGVGVFDNHFLNKMQGCINLGIQNNYFLSDRVQVNIDISSIIGWRIYQGDEDILPGITAGIIYLIKK